MCCIFLIFLLYHIALYYIYSYISLLNNVKYWSWNLIDINFYNITEVRISAPLHVRFRVNLTCTGFKLKRTIHHTTGIPTFLRAMIYCSAWRRTRRSTAVKFWIIVNVSAHRDASRPSELHLRLEICALVRETIINEVFPIYLGFLFPYIDSFLCVMKNNLSRDNDGTWKKKEIEC